ncbi:Na/Pi cotransporter family protein [Sedimentibacter saalensis]|jgi:phosphate:Na+ symporter|uniref:Phosphate:Na+ symporter n=1 Tax=Sedimentibacter saalensis TaxID=130788 RepID=A0A562JH91_9FIRM|nr:Na/Pi cotransporter family protein [Sedimentibacter saalensis]MEA5096572.1 Na/Pi cotransporter family protein [Sedimentibacter saalensis]TWH82632.1 phosphate:Na+ symporter [Sedimentibacter saalensis]
MDIAISLIGGLGLFLFGMNYMGDGLQKAAGSKMKDILAALTKNKLMGVLVGTLVTGVIQSSSATTVMVVGFVNAGLMNLHQAVGIIMGANIGTTVTAFLVSLNITKLATFMAGIGVILYLSSKKKKVKNIAEVIIGFGILFIGMDIMKDAMEPLESNPAFIGLMTKFSNPFIGILVGFVMTALLQSSSATTGILIAVAATGVISFESAYPIIFGQNIGTCVTALLASIGASKTAKRAAVIHLLFNVTGTLLFMIFMKMPVEWLVLKLVPVNVPQQIAAGHIFFNIINVVIMFPFSGLLVKASELLVKTDGEDSEHATKYIDERLLVTPSIALVQAAKEVLHLGNLAYEQFETAVTAFFNNDEELVYKVFDLEKKVNEVSKEALEYLVKLDKESMTDAEKDKLVVLMNSINDIERVGDHADNVGEFVLYKIENKVNFSEQAVEEIRAMFEDTMAVFKAALLALKTINCDDCDKVSEIDSRIDKAYKTLRKNHIERLNNYICEPSAGIIFLDIIGNLERIGDHSSNIAESIVEVISGKDEKK